MTLMALDQIDVSCDKERQVLKGFDLKVEKGELVSLLGSSDCGKPTTLRMMAGFIDPQGDTFSLDGEDMVKVPMHRKDFGLAFQNYALLPHLSAYDNVAFGLRTRKMDRAVIDTRVKDILEAYGLIEFAQRFPKQISGGQRQRVALARVLVIEPKLLFLDRPLSSLDAKLRISMRVEIRRLQKELGIAALFVTHDQEGCFSISNKVAMMNSGMIEQYDSPENIYARPVTESVVRFIGFKNFLKLGRSEDHEHRVKDSSRFQVDMEWDGPGFTGTIGPGDICLAEPGQQESVLTGTVGVRTFLGKSYQYKMNTTSEILEVDMDISHMFREGEELRLYLPKDKLVLVGR